jgi:outer membrane receptor for ferrienterochelin and colicins
MNALKSWSIVFFCFSGIVSSAAQSAAVRGIIIAEEGPLEFANVVLAGTGLGAVTSAEGEFEIPGVAPGSYELSVSAIGYQRVSKNVAVGVGERLDLGVLKIAEDILGLSTVVVTGTMKETFVAASPIKVDVITARYLEKNAAPTNLMEGITLVNGVQEVVACGVCFTNSISINGLPGAYTAVLMDGAPIYGNLASVYGLNGIPTTIIDRFEVVKGPGSTLYGSEAVAGVINIITKDPAKQPFISLDIMGTSHLESFGSIAIAPKLGRARGYVGLNYAYINDFDDDNGDGFGDVANLDRISLFSKWSLERKSGKKFTLAGKYYYEDRRNGVEAFLRERAYRRLRGSDEIYGESIYTNRAEVFGTYEIAGEENLKIDYSFSSHRQDSYYGADFYEARQGIAFANLTWRRITGRHDWLAGLTTRYQSYDDNTVATSRIRDEQVENRPDRQFIPGVFIQDEWRMSEAFTTLAGARLDHYKSHGLIFSPRLNLKYNPGTWTTLRLNFGTGFRIVNLFAEDHAFVTGQRSVEILGDLRPERSYNASLNFNHIYLLGQGQGMFDVDVFCTYFANKIIPDYGEPGKIIYANTDGHAVTRGVSLGLNYQFDFPLAFNLGASLQKATQTEPDETGVMQTDEIEYAPRWSGIATVNYEWKKQALTFAYTLRATGSMALPEVYDLDESGHPLPYPRPLRSEPFAIHNIQISKAFKKKNMEIYLGVQNLSGYIQRFSPLTGFNDPSAAPGFSEFFDTAYAFSPIHGREVYLGVKWSLGRQ